MIGQGPAGGIVLATLAVAGLLLSAARDGDAASAMGPDAIKTVDCKSRIQIIPAKDHPGQISPEARRISAFAGPVMFFGAKQWDDERFNPPGSDRPSFLKIPVVVNKGGAVTVSVASQEGRKVRIAIGLDRDNPPSYEYSGESIRLEPCDPDAAVAGRRVGRRTAFLGGVRFRGNQCVEMTVQVQGEAEAHQVAFGLGRLNCALDDPA